MECFSTTNTRSLLAPPGPDVVGLPGLAVCEGPAARWVGPCVGPSVGRGVPELTTDWVGTACPELLVPPQPVSMHANAEAPASMERAPGVTPSDGNQGHKRA